MNNIINCFLFLIIISFFSACAPFYGAVEKTKIAGEAKGFEDVYHLREVLFSKEKGITIGLANIRNYTSIKNNKNKIVRVIDQLKKYNVNMIIFPEFSLTGYFWLGEDQKESEACWNYMNNGVLNKHMSWLKTQVRSKLDDKLEYIIFNSIRDNPATASEPGLKKKFLNSTYVIDKTFDGDTLEANEKTHIYDKTFLPGIENIYTTTPKTDYLIITNKDESKYKYWEKIGFTTCYDMCFSEIYQEYAWVHGVQAILELASWRATGSKDYGKRTYDLECKACETCEWKPCTVRDLNYYGFQWNVMASDRAATNQIWMIAANAVGWQEKGGYKFWGGSGVWTPSGIKVVEASHDMEELIVVRNLPLSQYLESERERFNYEDDFNKVYRPIPNRWCRSSVCCSSNNCCGSFTRFE